MKSTAELGLTGVFVSEISRVFTPEYYIENNFQKPVAINEGYSFLSEGVTSTENRSVGKTEVSYFDFPFLDTSAISIYDFSTGFTNYKTVD